MPEIEVRARVNPLYKKGETADRIHYHPIAELNTEYKLFTAVLAYIIQESSPNWVIAKGQLGRKGVWETIQGLLWGNCARISERENHSEWYDLRKAYDSLNQVQITRLVKALSIIPQATNTIISLMNK